jgi:hypothetical protein
VKSELLDRKGIAGQQVVLALLARLVRKVQDYKLQMRTHPMKI